MQHSRRGAQLQRPRNGPVDGEHGDNDESAVEGVQQGDIARQVAPGQADDLEENGAVGSDRVAERPDLRNLGLGSGMRQAGQDQG